MRHLRILGLGLVVAVALTAVIGAGPAAAKTVLCATTSTPCAVPYAETTKYDGVAVLETIFDINKSETPITKCKKSEIKGSVTKGKEETAFLGIGEMIWGECESPVKTVANGELEIHHIEGTDNGTVTMKFTEITISVLGADCIFSAGNGVDFGTLRGEIAKPLLFGAPDLPKVSGSVFCPPAVRMTIEYVLLEPRPLFVES